MKVVKYNPNRPFKKGEIELEENQYFASCVYGARWKFPNLYGDELLLACLQHGTDRPPTLYKKPEFNCCNNYGTNIIVEIEPFDKYVVFCS